MSNYIEITYIELLWAIGLSALTLGILYFLDKTGKRRKDEN